MKVSYNWLKDFVPNLPSPQKLAELFTFKFFEVESIEKKGSDYIFSIDILPNRIPDCGGHEGVAKEAAAITNLKFINRSAKLIEMGKKTQDALKIMIKDKDLCTRYCARVIRGVSVKASPLWIAERLISCGLKPINNIVDATNYIMLETGQPLHAFDKDKISGSAIFARRSRSGERITTLDDKTYILPEGTLLIADNKNPLAIAGIKGGKVAEITESTKNIVLESANFDRGGIRKTTRMLGLETDSSVRFKAGLPFELTTYAINKAASLIHEIAGGEVFKGIADSRIKIMPKSPIRINMAYVESLLGVPVELAEALKILESLGFIISKIDGKNKAFSVKSPDFREDMTREEDVIEEIGRIYGYEKIIPSSPMGKLIPPVRNDCYFLMENLRSALMRSGFMEVINYAFQSANDIEIFSAKKNDYIEVLNPISHEYKYLRGSLFHGLLRNVRDNFKHVDEMFLFEAGSVFRNFKTGHSEKEHISALLAEKSKNTADDAKMFFEAKGCASFILESMGEADYWFADAGSRQENLWPLAHENIMHPYRRAAIKAGSDIIGSLFELHPKILNFYGIAGRAAAFEFDVEKILDVLTKEKEFQPFSKYPSVMRDLAVLTPQETQIIQILDVIENTAGPLLIDTDLFDYYEGAGIPDGKKNIAFHLIFQSPSRTLRESEVNDILKKIIKALEAKPEWEVRK